MFKRKKPRNSANGGNFVDFSGNVGVASFCNESNDPLLEFMNKNRNSEISRN